MDRLEAMSILLTVVDRGSITAAGKFLNAPVATLSRKISQLEEHIGTALLTRTTRHLALTEAGQAYVAAARRILEQVDEAERFASGEFIEPKGELVLAAPIAFGRLHILPLVAGFLEQFGEISIRMVLSDRNAHLVDDHIDLAVRIGKLPDSGLIATRIGSMRSVVCASPTLLGRVGAPTLPESLQELPCIGVDAPMPSPGWRFRDRSGTGSIEIQPATRLTVSTAEAACDAAIAGVGIVRLLHYQVDGAIRRGDLLPLLEDYEPDPAPIHLVHVDRAKMPLKLRSFIDFAVPNLRGALRSFGAS